MHAVNKVSSEAPLLPPPKSSSSSLFSWITNYFWPPTPPLPPLSVVREVVPLTVDRPKETEDKKEINCKPVISVAVEALPIRPKPPLFVPYTIKIGSLPNRFKSFEVVTLEQEEIVMKELTDLVDQALEPIHVCGGLPEKEFAKLMQDYQPHHMRLRELFEQRFAIYNKGPYFEAIGPKIAKKEDRGDGITIITYQNGKVKTVLQPYSEIRHPWARQIVEQGIELPSHTLESLQQAIPKLQNIAPNFKKAVPDGIHLFRGANLIFSLDTVPGVIFKRAHTGRAVTEEYADRGNKDTAERFEKMVKAQFVCRALGLDLLVVPSAKKVTVEYLGQSYLFIAEERLNVDADHRVQEECYRKYTCGMNELVKQLIQFIRHTRLSDVSWRNLPLLKDHVAKVALIDLDRLDTSVSLGLLGTGEEPERGLLNCLFSEEQIDQVVEAVRPYDLNDAADGMKQRRLQELQQEAKLHQFHVEKGLFQEPDRPIHLMDWTEADWEKLELNLEETSPIFSRKETEDPASKTITLRQAVVDVVNAINHALQNPSSQASLKDRRCVVFNLDDCHNAFGFEGDNERTQRLSRLSDYGRYLGLHKTEKPAYQMSPQESGQYLWLDRIARALVLAGHLCSFEKKGANYILQA